MHLSHAIRTLVTGVSTEDDEDDRSLPCQFGQTQRCPSGVDSVKTGAFWPTSGVSAEATTELSSNINASIFHVVF
jgi:hypothetical protein